MKTVAVDLGNTRAKFGYFPSLTPEGAFPEPMSTFSDTSGDFVNLTYWLQDLSVAETEPLSWQIARTGLFPWSEFQSKIAISRPFDTFVELQRQDMSLVLDVEFPDKVGIDRILAACAALCWRQMPEHAAHFSDSTRFIVVDAGSAITVDLVGGEKQFAGGAILPGLAVVAQALSSISPRLPKIQTQDIAFAVYPGKNTDEALTAGIYWGAVGAIRQLSQIVESSLIDAELPSRVPIFLTGGDADTLYAGLSMFAADSKLVISLPNLVLSGIAIAARQTQNL